jgi:4-hydroxyphenylpyruvate dioxygenase
MTERPMRWGIATVSLSGVLTEKLAAAAAAGFDGVEIFDNDLIASPLSPSEVAARCADLGLSIDLLQPMRDVEGLTEPQFAQAERRIRRKLAIAAELGAPTVLVCSNVRPDAIDDPDLSAAQLARLGELAADHGVVLAFEALAWGRRVDRVSPAWDIVQRAGHPAVTLAVDTFHMLSRGDGVDALSGVPGDRIGFLQVADAPVLDMNVLEWSRHHRCFPGQGTMEVAAVVSAVVDAGYDGPLSLEVFNDIVREAPAIDTARDAMRSLAFLEDELARRSPRLTPAAPAAPDQVDAAFVELTPSAATDDLLSRLGFTIAGWHRHKPVVWWRNGNANILTNRAAAAPAIAIATAPVGHVAERARTLLWSSLEVDRVAGDAPLPGISSPDGLAVFVSGTHGDEDWHHDFGRVEPPNVGGWTGIDHIGITVVQTKVNEVVAFLRTVLGLRPAPLEEFMDPQGRIRSRAFRPRHGNLRVVINVADTTDANGGRRPSGVTQLAFACEDLPREVRRLREAGVPLLAVPDNYYADLDARFDLEPHFLAELKGLGILYDRADEGELLHAYTPVLGQGFYVELLERRGAYDGYGAANTHVRLAGQAPPAVRQSFNLVRE